MDKKEIVAIAGFFVAVLTLLFGDNIYQQVTGRSFYASRDAPKLEPTFTVAVNQPTTIFAPIATPIFTPTVAPKPTLLGKLHIPGNLEEGVRFIANKNGRYIFTYIGGAYSPWSDAQPTQARWRTSIAVYRNRPIEWAQRPYNPEDDKSIIYKEPSNPDGFIGQYDVTTQSEAISVAKSASSLQFDLQAGEYLIFIALDDQGWYNNPAPNIGEVIFEISFISR
ncbi:MAG: hypothetical protein QXS54_07885 [Candidatus Methanomethylicaceae archaeon]